VRGYTDGNLVEFTNWPLIAALYPGLPYDTNGLIWADQPWSGWYSVGPTAWAIAQVTQFTQPGWTFIPAASGYLGGNEPNGTYMTLMSPNGADYSTVIETTTATTAQTVNFSVAGGLSTGPLQVWTTNLGSTSPTDWFKRQSSVVTPIVSSSGATYSLTLQPNFVYSITTLATGGKDAAASPIPASAEMSLPYSDSFAEYPAGAEAKYLAQIQGDFQSQPCVGQTANNCITQVVPDAPSVGFDGLVGTPWAVLGDVFWSNYTVSVDALLEQSGAVFLAGLVSAPGDTNPAGNLPEYFNGYSILVGSNGAWSLLKDSVSSAPTPLSSGSVAAPGLNAWVKLTMTFNGTNVSASIDGIQVASVTDSTYSAGQVGFGVAGWQTAQFSNLSVAPEPQSFKIASSAPNLSVAQGGSVIDSVKVTAASSFDGTVSFSVSGLPGGVTGVFSPATGATGSVLTLTAGGNAAPGTYPVIVTGTAGAQTATAGIMLTVVVDPCLIVPYIALNGVWNQMPESTVTAPLGTSVDLGPWPTTGGSWSWTGPNGFTSTSREIDNIALPSATNTYSATYTVGSCTSTQPFVITVGTGANPIIPYIAVNGVWNQTPESAVTVARGTSVNLGPWPLSGGSWSWTGPNGFTSTSREIDNIALPAATDIYTATYTVSGSSYTQAFTITVD
jgi:hypothetical protein